MQRRKANTNRVFIFSDFLGLYRTANRFSAFRSCKIMTQRVNCSLKYRSSGTPLVNLELSSYIYLPMKQTNHPVIYQSCQSCVFSSCGKNPTSQSSQATQQQYPRETVTRGYKKLTPQEFKIHYSTTMASNSHLLTQSTVQWRFRWSFSCSSQLSIALFVQICSLSTLIMQSWTQKRR